MLADYRVVQLGQSLACQWAGAILAEHGVQVVQNIRPHTLSWLGQHKLNLSGMSPNIEDFAAVADLWLQDDVFQAGSTAAPINDAGKSLVQLHFGPFKSAPLQEIDAQIMRYVGLYQLLNHLPVKFHPLPLASYIAGIEAAAAALACLFGSQKDQGPRKAKIDVIDAALGLQSLKALLLGDKPDHWSPIGSAASAFMSLYGCAHGTRIYLHLGFRKHLRKFLDFVATQDSRVQQQIDERLDSATRQNPSAPSSFWRSWQLRRILKGFFKQRPARFWHENLGRLGLPVVQVLPPHLTTWLPESHSHTKPTQRIDQNDPDKTLKAWQSLATTKKISPPIVLKRALPLDGVRIADFSHVIAGPLIARTAAELGAEVIHFHNPNWNQWFVDSFRALYHRGKQSIVLDWHNPQEKRQLDDFLLTWQPQIIVENFSPGVLDRHFAAILKQLNETSVISVRAYEPHSPYAGRTGFEQTLQAQSGIMTLHGRPKKPSLMLAPIVDTASGYMGLVNLIVALLDQKTGKSRDYSVSLERAAYDLVSMPKARRPRSWMKKNKFQDLVRLECSRSDGVFSLQPYANKQIIVSRSAIQFRAESLINLNPACQPGTHNHCLKAKSAG